MPMLKRKLSVLEITLIKEPTEEIEQQQKPMRKTKIKIINLKKKW